MKQPSTKTVIVPAQPGFAVMRYQPGTDAEPESFQELDVIAWAIMTSEADFTADASTFVQPVTLEGIEAEGHENVYVVRVPSGQFERAGAATYATKAAALEDLGSLYRRLHG